MTDGSFTISENLSYAERRQREREARKGRLVPREVVSFTLRDGRNPSRNAAAWSTEMAHWFITPPREERVTSIAAHWRLDAAANFGREAPLILEIGAGTGDAVLDHAAAHPEWNHLAVEVYRPGLARTVVLANERSLANIRVLEGDGRALIARNIPPRSLREVHIWFADPWPKAKHHKRRLIDARFLRDVAASLSVGGVLRMATDWADYAEQIEREAREVSELRSCGSTGGSPRPGAASGTERVAAGALYGQVPRYAGRPMTRFESKGTDLGRPIADFAFAVR